MPSIRDLTAYVRPPDPRPIREIEREIREELDFHLHMRTLDNVDVGMSPEEAGADARKRFGDFRRIHQACRRTQLGERIVLHRIQAVLTVALLGAVVYLGVTFYQWQRAN